MNETIQNILTYLIQLFLIGSIGLLVPLSRAWLKTHVSSNEFQLIQNVTDNAVRMVEQQLENAPNDEKKAAAVAAVREYTDSKNITLPDATLHSAIESSVQRMKEVPVPVQLSPATYIPGTTPVAITSSDSTADL